MKKETYLLIVNKSKKRMAIMEMDKFEKLRKSKEYSTHFSSHKGTRLYECSSKNKLYQFAREIKSSWTEPLYKQIAEYENIQIEDEKGGEVTKYKKEISFM